MIHFVFGVPGKLKTLLTRLSAARAAKLDSVTLNTIWTNARAAKLDTVLSNVLWDATKASYLDTAISSTAIQGYSEGFVSSSLLTTGSGQDAKYVNVPISVADYTKCKAWVEGGAGTNTSIAMYKSGSTSAYTITARLTSNNNLRVSCSAAAPTSMAFAWSIIELY